VVLLERLRLALAIPVAGGAVVDGPVTAGLLGVESVPIDVGNDQLILGTLQRAGEHFADRDGVFALALEVAAVARFPDDVRRTAKGHLETQVASLFAKQRAVLISQFQVPA
jgi:hypothetical protein